MAKLTGLLLICIIIAYTHGFGIDFDGQNKWMESPFIVLRKPTLIPRLKQAYIDGKSLIKPMQMSNKKSKDRELESWPLGPKNLDFPRGFKKAFGGLGHEAASFLGSRGEVSHFPPKSRNNFSYHYPRQSAVFIEKATQGPQYYPFGPQMDIRMRLSGKNMK